MVLLGGRIGFPRVLLRVYLGVAEMPQRGASRWGLVQWRACHGFSAVLWVAVRGAKEGVLGLFGCFQLRCGEIGGL